MKETTSINLYCRQFIFPPEVGPNGENLGQTFTLPEVATDKNLEELVDDGANAYDDVICFEIIGGKQQRTLFEANFRGENILKNIWLDLVLLRSFAVEGNVLNFLKQQQQQDPACANNNSHALIDRAPHDEQGKLKLTRLYPLFKDPVASQLFTVSTLVRDETSASPVLTVSSPDLVNSSLLTAHNPVHFLSVLFFQDYEATDIYTFDIIATNLCSDDR